MFPREKCLSIRNSICVTDIPDCHFMKGCNKQENFIFRDDKTEA